MAEAPVEPRIGVDEWVASVERHVRRGRLGFLQARWERVPALGRLAVFVIPVAFIPLMTHDGYKLQVAINTGLLILLSIGLNVTVGWNGLLDLGYIAFYGFGAYAFAMLASAHTGLHWQAEAAIPVVVLATALLGFLLGLPSWRLSGDYLAIVTLFFIEIFLTVVNNGQRIRLPFVQHLEGGLTRGPNGISTVDPLNLFGYQLHSLTQYFYFLLTAFVLVIGGLHFLNESRIGRAWRALREDSLAAEQLSIPVDRLKLIAFAFGAAVAGLAGTIFAAEQGAVFPSEFDLPLLITIYAMVILGGAGSLAGVTLGAVVINISLEVLRTPSNASWVFYVALALTLAALIRPWRWWIAGAVVAGTIGLGFAAHAIARTAWPVGVEGQGEGGAWIDHAVRSWALLPKDPVVVGRWAYAALIASVLALVLLRRTWRLVALPAVIYLAVFVWENVLVPQSAVTRYILLGGLLVAMMAARPQGLLGQQRVEIV